MTYIWKFHSIGQLENGNYGNNVFDVSVEPDRQVMISKWLLFKLTIHMSVLSACLNSYLLLLNQHRSYGSIFFIVITDNFHHLLMKFHSYVQTHFYIPNDKNWTVDVKFYHLLQTVAHKQLTTGDCSLSPWNSQIFPIFKMITLHNFKLKQKVSQWLWHL